MEGKVQDEGKEGDEKAVAFKMAALSSDKPHEKQTFFLPKWMPLKAYLKEAYLYGVVAFSDFVCMRINFDYNRAIYRIAANKI